jgi:hypothetical protein
LNADAATRREVQRLLDQVRGQTARPRQVHDQENGR